LAAGYQKEGKTAIVTLNRPAAFQQGSQAFIKKLKVNFKAK